MGQKQRFDGALFDIGEVMEVLAIYYSTVSICEHAGSAVRRYPRSWQRRTLIKACRGEYSTVAYGLGYGADWLGRKVIERPGQKPEVKIGRAVKSEVLDSENENRIPVYAMKIAAAQIRQANMLAWMLARNEHKEVVYAPVVPLRSVG